MNSRDDAEGGEDRVDSGTDVGREEMDRESSVPWDRGIDRDGDVDSGV